jgi:hypothetical protein
MQEALPFGYDEERAARIQPLLKKMVASALAASVGSYE